MEFALVVILGLILIILCIFAISKQNNLVMQERFNQPNRSNAQRQEQNLQRDGPRGPQASTSGAINAPQSNTSRTNDIVNTNVSLISTTFKQEVQDNSKIPISQIYELADKQSYIYQMPFSKNPKDNITLSSPNFDPKNTSWLKIDNLNKPSNELKPKNNLNEIEEKKELIDGGFLLDKDGRYINEDWYSYLEKQKERVGKQDKIVNLGLVEPFDPVDFYVQQNLGAYPLMASLKPSGRGVDKQFDMTQNISVLVDNEGNKYKACVCAGDKCIDGPRSNMNDKTSESEKNKSLLIFPANIQANQKVDGKVPDGIKIVKKDVMC